MSLSINLVQDAIFSVGPKWIDNGLYDNGQLIEGSKFNRRIAVPKTIAKDNYDSVITEPTFYLGVLYSCWGNCITDSLKFLWPLLNAERYPYLKNCKFVYSEVKLFGKPLPDNYWKILRMFGITEDRIAKLHKNTLLSQCYVADECYVQDDKTGLNYGTDEYNDVIDFICRKCTEANPGDRSDKVYFTRSNWHRWEYGEKSVEDVFKKAGYSIISPECQTLEEMVATLQNVSDFASTDGSCAHNAVFLRPGTRAVFLRKFDFNNKYQRSINEIRKLNATFIDANLSRIFYDDKDKLGGPFFIYPSKALRSYLHCKGAFPVLEYLKYLLVANTLHYGHLLGGFIRNHSKKSPSQP